MRFKNLNRSANLHFLVAIFFALTFLPAQSQNKSQNGADDLDARITRLNRRITFGVNKGTIHQAEADKLRADLADINARAAAARKSNGGQLKPEDLTGFENQLNQKFNIIRSYNGAGEKSTASSSATGPVWAPGTDGAQNPQTLKKRMKVQERKQLEQEDQAIMQVKEQQQQQYEKQMLEKLGNQRNTILQNKDAIDKVRQDSGAN
jgi:hypothetical protein